MNVGIAGFGFMGHMHLGAFAKLDRAKVVAVCSSNKGSTSKSSGNLELPDTTQALSGAQICTDWHELISMPEIDAVDVCLPTDLHAPVTIAALSAGKDVLCEKPMALDTSNCDLMIQAAEQHRRILMIGHVLRFWPEYRRLDEFVRSGEYGAMRSVTFVRRCGLPDWSSWLGDESRSGGAVVDLLLHDIDQALMLFGAPKQLRAKSLGPMDTLSATLLYPNGPEVRIQGGWFQPGVPLAMSFQARADRAELDFGPSGLKLNDMSGQSKIIQTGSENAYESEVAYFVDCCRNRKQPERCPPQESARAVKLALLLKQSRELGGELIECTL